MVLIPDGHHGSHAEKTKEELKHDFTLSDLIHLAEKEGIKKPGVGWGNVKHGTPQKKKTSIIEALVSHWEKKAIIDDECVIGTIDTGSWCNFYIEDGDKVPTEYMTRDKYRKHLLQMNPPLISEDQHIFHIIASANGGADHPDNYLAALGSSFNMSIGKRMDPFTCFIAGKEKTQKAVAISIQAEALYKQDPRRYKTVIDKRQKGAPAFFSDCHFDKEKGRCLTGEELWAQGRAAWALMRESWFRYVKQQSCMDKPIGNLSLVVKLDYHSEADHQSVSCRSLVGDEFVTLDLQRDMITFSQLKKVVAKKCGVESKSIVFVFNGAVLNERGQIHLVDVFAKATGKVAQQTTSALLSASALTSALETSAASASASPSKSTSASAPVISTGYSGRRGSSRKNQEAEMSPSKSETSSTKLYIGARGGLPKTKNKLMEIAEELSIPTDGLNLKQLKEKIKETMKSQGSNG